MFIVIVRRETSKHSERHSSRHECFLNTLLVSNVEVRCSTFISFRVMKKMT